MPYQISFQSDVRELRNTIRKLTENYEEKRILRHRDLDFWPMVTNFNQVRASVVSNHLAKTASKLMHPFGWKFVYKHSHTHTHTHTHTDRHTDKLQWKYNPFTISWRCNNYYNYTFKGPIKIKSKKILPLNRFLKGTNRSLLVNISCINSLRPLKFFKSKKTFYILAWNWKKSMGSNESLFFFRYLLPFY